MTFEFGPEDQIQSVSDYLKRVRIRRELSLAEVSIATKIHEKFLTALEENDDTLFSDNVYKDLFLKSYAEFLGISIEEILLRMPDVAAPLPEGAKPPLRPPRAGLEVEGKSPAPVAAQVEERTRSGFGQSVVIAVLVVLILVLGFFLVRLILESRQQTGIILPPTTPQMPVAVESTAVVVDSTDSTKAIDSTRTKVEVVDSMFLLLVGKERCWFGIRKDDDTVFTEGVLQSNDTLWFAMRDSIYFKLGRANAVDAYFNAFPLKLASDDDTSVADFQITRENYFQYVDSARLAQ